ncbi:response regulator [Noviherbaspirillum sp.]|uniref:response regulator n=1 Tax=Noviherbaspirillum sp. TaxID=1926288 RepID=UPI002FE09713
MDFHERAARREPIFAGYRILVADDNLVNQQLAVRMLEGFGCRVEVADNGREAVRVHAALPCDLLFMDCRMPQMDGYEATVRIRARESASRRTPIVALTASLTDETRRACAVAGMDDFLPKPIRQAPLKTILSRWLRPDAPLLHQVQESRAAYAAADAYTPVSGDELEAVQAVFGNDFNELAMLYRRDGSKRIAILTKAAAEGDSRQLARIAHLLCGSSASIGAMQLSAMCKQLEVCAKAGRDGEAGQLLQAIAAEYARIELRLQSMTGY